MYPWLGSEEFYKKSTTKPRIFGKTASPVVGKDSCNQGNLAKSINNLENILDTELAYEDGGAKFSMHIDALTADLGLISWVGNDLNLLWIGSNSNL
ncbi:hypothetical protein FNV43_RR03880 [Rhamnella rubrinervis]|uniref:Uncharacterized protein n=1 Tax=Rhamnella rubrinervis TaxID=2594499 RepID=A0A8K0MQ21_9ROSA|nr:hypothetical protein FNV43_RR03880 [Rhamnella rubrinervis]